MSLRAAYLGVILIWSTTPLAIKWSGEGPGFLFGVSARMVLGALLSVLILLALAGRLPWHRAAVKTYLVGSIGILGAMTSVYWGAQYIPSGLISVIFGLTPIVTGVIAAVWLGEQSLTLNKLGGVLLGLAGLVVIFGTSIRLEEYAVYGVAAVFLSVVLHSLSTVLVKGINANLTGLQATCGALLVAAPGYLLAWWLIDGQWPADLNPRALGSILYLALFGSVLGFVMFFYILNHIDASRVALITLITPVLALLLGQVLNNEQIGVRVYLGALLILLGMSLYQWGGLLLRYLRHRNTAGMPP